MQVFDVKNIKFNIFLRKSIFFVFEILLKNGLFERVFFAYLLKNTLVFLSYHQKITLSF